MPELPEVETTKEGLKRDLLGQKILKVEISDKKLRFPYDKNFIKRITGEYILSITPVSYTHLTLPTNREV